MEDHWIPYYDTLLQYYLGIDPGKLSDEEWALKVEMLKKIREDEAKAKSNS